MFLEKIKSEGLAHLSYILGDGGEAAVIDPRRDCGIYREIADREGCRITRIFETHRNEDYVIGSCELAARSGAAIFHGGELPFRYGETAAEGDEFRLGNLRLKTLETPGHTYESISIVVYDDASGDSPAAVFTGDVLFIGDTGRTDFYPKKGTEPAELLHRSIFDKILPLGDGVILLPAHGAGSVCGSSLADREFSTLGYERLHNPALRYRDREKFVAMKMGQVHHTPPYFKMMEKLNLEGPPVTGRRPEPAPWGPGDFAAADKNGMIILDLRSPEAVAGAFIPGSLAIPRELLSSYAGWFLEYGRPLGLVVEGGEEVKEAVRFLYRLGYGDIPAFLENALHRWEISGRRYGRIPAVHAAEIVARIQGKEEFTILDVRGGEEFADGHLPEAVNIYLGELPGRLEEIPSPRPLVTFCGSGQRAIIAASFLKREGFSEVEVCLGSMQACAAIGCPIRTGER